jgi:ATP-dependent protease ClpP protease subunit
VAERQETLLERLIPGDLEHQIPAAVEKVLPGGFKNRLIQIVLGALITFGFSFVVRRMIEKREAKQAALAPVRQPESLPRPLFAEPAPPPPVTRPMTEPTDTSAPAAAPPPRPPEGRATRYPLLSTPHIHLSGTVDHAMYQDFRQQLAAAPKDGPLVVAISTLGGDPEVARLMGDELRLIREYTGREMLFLGKVAVYSAGATFMASFPVDKRFLTRGTRLMVHERIMSKTVEVSGPLKTCVAALKATLHEIEESVRIEEEGFRDFIAGSRVPFEDICKRAPANWYIEAEEARGLGLVLDVI